MWFLIYLNSAGDERIASGISANYFQPYRFSLEATYSSGKIGGEGLIFFKSYKKEKNSDLTLKTFVIDRIMSKTEINYVTNTDVTVENSRGIHGGYNNLKNNIWSSKYNLQFNEIFLGLGYTHVWFTKFFIFKSNDKKKEKNINKSTVCIC